MHVTSDYYRNRDHRPVESMGLAERWSRAVRNAARAVENAQSAEPLRPSAQTLQNLASSYHKSHRHIHPGT